MNIDKCVMESHRNLVGRVCLVLNPKTGIAENCVDTLLNFSAIDTDIFVRYSIDACPLPHVSKHALVQSLPEGFIGRIILPSEDPDIGF